MKLNQILSALTAVITAIPCMYVPSVSAISSQSTSTTASETEKEPVYIPDFPEEILKEFNISKTGLSSNVRAESTSYDNMFAHNDFFYDGGRLDAGISESVIQDWINSMN